MLVKNQLDQKEVEYDVVNIDENTEARDMLIDLGIMAAPVLKVEGDYLSKMEDINKAISMIGK